MTKIQADWIAADWGTTHMRAWAMSNEGKILAKGSSDKGMNQLQADDFEPALFELIHHWLADNTITKVIACGMVGAKQGWVEARYHEVPCFPLEMMHLTQAKTRDNRVSVFVLPGLMQKSPTDIMRGEECQIAGLLSKEPDYTGTVCLPGTHSKWVSIEGGKVLSFKTYMTGELFALLSQQSVLRHSINTKDHKWSEEVFTQAVSFILESPQQLSSELFSIRSDSIINEDNADIAQSRLSGLLIGSELAASKKFWEDQKVTFIGSENLITIYEQALKKADVITQKFNATEMTLAGLKLAYDAVLKDYDL